MDQLTIKCTNTTTDADGSVYGRYVVEPLEKGYGTTLGNALRRVLLSSLEGCAITSLRIEGVTHEFMTINGVVEDVLDVILNLRSVVFKSDFSEPQTLSIRVNKPGPVLAQDIELPAGVTIINPDTVICTVSEGGQFNADLVMETGKGYVPAEKRPGMMTVDYIPVDASFMPIRRVSYTVEDTRIGQQINYDKLTLEIWSNGSLDISKGLSISANKLIEHFLPIASLSGIPTVMTQSRVDAETEESNVPNITVEDLELSVRAFNCLKRANIHSIQELLQKSEADLLNIKNFGKKSSDEVIERLATFSLSLKPNPEGYVPSEHVS
jgi:DNA-directed RNA polymerase subunit alpha